MSEQDLGVLLASSTYTVGPKQVSYLPGCTQLVGGGAGVTLPPPVSGAADFSLLPAEFYPKLSPSGLQGLGGTGMSRGGWAALVLCSENALIFQVCSLKA